MLDAHGKHQSPPSPILCHLAGGIAVALHERDESRAGERGVVDGRAFRPEVREVVPHPTPAFHELHLLLIDEHHAAIGVGIAIESHDETVGQRRHLEVVSDARHRAARWYQIPEMVEQLESLLGRNRIGIFVLYACYLVGDTPMHVLGRLFVDIPKAVFHGVFVHPDTCGKFVA